MAKKVAKKVAAKQIANSPKNENYGLQAEDIIGGFEGTITGFSQYMTGCDQYLITPKDGKDGKWFDVNRLVITKGKRLTIDTSSASGAMDEAPIK